MKAVIIVGPASETTREYLDLGDLVATQAEAMGMDVRRVFHPRATWERVLDNIQGANLVVYIGHGNGWPSPHGPFQEDTKDGFGLDPTEGASAYSAKYYGADKLRAKIKLAPKSVVLLYRLCYSAGNGEQSEGPEFNRKIAVQRVDNFAAGFLDIGASAVFAYGGTQLIDFPKALARSDKTIDGIFMTSSPHAMSYYDSFLGWDDYYRPSSRTRGARLHLDPHPQRGHYRAVTGDLTMTAAEWRGGAPPADTVAPKLRVRGALSDGKLVPADAHDPATFSPNGDTIEERLVVDETLSEPAKVALEVRDADDRVVRTATVDASSGPGHITWDGHGDDGSVVADGRYVVTLTPSDHAGNVGVAKTVVARVITTLKSPRLVRQAINVADGDRLAAVTRLGVTLTQDASVTWRVTGPSGGTVRTRYSDDPLPAGRLTWTWDGFNEAGRPVADGWYTATVAATTDVGTVRASDRIYVGAYRIKVGDAKPARGQRLSIVILSTEALARPPVVEIRQPGRAPVTVHTRRIGGDRYRVKVRLSSKGKSGKLRLTVRGRDTGGQTQSATRTLRVH